MVWYREEAGCGIGRRKGMGYRSGRVLDREEKGCGIGRREDVG